MTKLRIRRTSGLKNMGLPDLWETGWSDISLKRSKRIKRLCWKYRCKVCVILRSFAGDENGLDPEEGKALRVIADTAEYRVFANNEYLYFWMLSPETAGCVVLKKTSQQMTAMASTPRQKNQTISPLPKMTSGTASDVHRPPPMTGSCNSCL